MTSNRDECPPSPSEQVDHGLPMATLEWVWSCLGVRYGHFFAGKWDGFNLAIVKEDWRLQLGRLTDHQLQYGVDHLPEGRPPADVGEFRRICLQAPEPKPQLALPRKRGPVQIPAKVRAEFDRLRPQDDEEPGEIRAARARVSHLERQKVLGEVQKEALAAARRVIRRYEAGRPKQEQGAAAPATTQP